jgi:hypothetical protein
MDPLAWNLLHDATVTACTATAPGVLRIEIESDYLRSRFHPPGRSFVLTLHRCRRFVFRPCAGALPVTDLLVIEKQRLWILSADQAGTVCTVHCQHEGNDGGGTLEVEADEAALALDTGREIKMDELRDVATAYWDEWPSSGQ